MTIIMVFGCPTRVLFFFLFLFFTVTYLSLYMLVSNFLKSSLNALNNTFRIIKKINRFSKLTRQQRCRKAQEYPARKTQTEVRTSGIKKNPLTFKLLALAEGLLLNYKEGNIPGEIALSQLLTNKSIVDLWQAECVPSLLVNYLLLIYLFCNSSIYCPIPFERQAVIQCGHSDL